MGESKDQAFSSDDFNDLSPLHQEGQKGRRGRTSLGIVSVVLLSQAHGLESVWASCGGESTVWPRTNLAALKLLHDAVVVDHVVVEEETTIAIGVVAITTPSFCCYYAPT